MNPYAILGLDEDESDERTIKRAYAKLLKQHRPDQDPEGFTRIHEAYQRALRMADEDDDNEAPRRRLLASASIQVAPRVVSVDQECAPASGVIPPEPTVPEAAESPLMVPSPKAFVPPPTAWDIALAELHRVAEQPESPLRHEALLAGLRRLAGLVTQRLGEASVLTVLLSRYLSEGRTQWRFLFDDDDLLADMRRGNSELTAHTLRGCFECGDWVRLRQFAKRWLEEDADTLEFSDAVALTRVLAVWLAPFEYALADQLVGRLPLTMRRHADHELDTLLAVGRDAAILPDDSRLYLCELLVGRTPPMNDDLRWRTCGLMSQVPVDSPLRRMLNQRATEHFSGLVAPAGTSGITMLGVALGIVGLCLWALPVGLVIATMDTTQIKTFGLLLTILMAVAIYFALRWVYRRLSPRYHTRWRPWLWRYCGPFDWPLFFLLLYGWISLGSVTFAQSATNPGLTMAWFWVVPPVLIVLIHHLRRMIRVHPQAFPPWQDIPARMARVQRLYVLDIAMLQALRNLGQILLALIAACPAAFGTTVLIGGLALCPGLSWDDQSEGTGATLVWSGPAALILAALHAWWRRWWEHGRRPWWWPLILLGGCILIPGFTWLISMGPVWLSWRSVPTNGWLTMLALWFIADITYRVWLRFGRRLPAL